MEPKTIIGVLNELVYEVKSLIGNNSETDYCTLMIPYTNGETITKLSTKIMHGAEYSEGNYEEIEDLLDINEGSNGFMVQTMWLGLPEECDYTWQPLEVLYEDVPELVVRFLDTCNKTEMVRQAKTKLEIN